MSDPLHNRPPVARETLLRALVAMLPHASVRGDLGFTEDAREDAVMEAILRVLEAEERDPEPSATADRVARRYASRVVHNLLVDRFRRERHLPTQPLDDVTDLPAGSAEPGTGRPSVKRRRAIALLGDLSTDEQALLSAYFLGSDAFRDEVRRLGITEGAARVRVHRLIKRLRDRAAQEGRPRPPHP